MDIREFESQIQAKGELIAQKTRVVEEVRASYLSAIKALDDEIVEADKLVKEYVNTPGNKTREGVLAMKEVFVKKVGAFNFKLNTSQCDVTRASELANLRMFNLVSKCCNPLWEILGERS